MSRINLDGCEWYRYRAEPENSRHARQLATGIIAPSRFARMPFEPWRSRGMNGGPSAVRANRARPNFDSILHEKNPDYGWSGYSAHNEAVMTEMESTRCTPSACGPSFWPSTRVRGGRSASCYLSVMGDRRILRLTYPTEFGVSAKRMRIPLASSGSGRLRGLVKETVDF